MFIIIIININYLYNNYCCYMDTNYTVINVNDNLCTLYYTPINVLIKYV